MKGYKMDNRDLLEKLSKLLTLAKKYNDPARYFSAHVHMIVVGDNKIGLTYTNGHLAIKETVANESVAYRMGKDEFWIHFNELPKIKQCIKKKHDEIYIDAKTTESNSLIIKASSSQGDFELLASNIEKYPNVWKVMRKKQENDYHISFNAEYLYEMVKAMRDDRHKGVAIYFDKPLEPLTIIAGGNEATLMPMRL